MEKIKALFFFTGLFSISMVSLSQTFTPPFNDHFEGSNLGWTTTTVSGSSWQKGFPTTTFTNSVHSGSKAWDVELHYDYKSATESYLISPDFDFTTISNATIGFWQNKDVESGWDGAWLEYSTDGGLTWTQLGTNGSPGSLNWYNDTTKTGHEAWNGVSFGWIKSTYSLDFLNGSGIVKFRFVFYSDNVIELEGFTMDDFEITVEDSIDVGVSAFIEPNSNSQANTNIPVTVVITNFGLNNLTTMDTGFDINGLPQNIYSWTGNLSQGATDTVTIGNMFVPSGFYDICAYTILLNDVNGGNDTLCENICNTNAIQVFIADSLSFIECLNPPLLDVIYVYGQVPSLLNGDSVLIHINFGDGLDTNVVSIVNSHFFIAHIPHWYLFTGQFSMEVIATSDTISDTTVNYNQLIVGTSCGNISGKIYLDANNNCIFDSTDNGLTNMPVKLLQGGNIIQTCYSDTNGDYFFIVPASIVYDLKIDTNHPGIISYCPTSGTITGISEPSISNDFAIVPLTTFDIEPFINPFSIRANVNSLLFFGVQNNQFSVISGSLKFIMDTSLFQLAGAIPSVSAINGDTLTWNINYLSNLYNNNSFNVEIELIPIPALALGDTVCFQVMAEPVNGDINPLNNYKTNCGLIVNSYDPNNKTVEPHGIGPSGYVDPSTPSFNYTVNFQNTGNAPAFNVFILDSINSNLDINSLVVTNNSHPASVSIIDTNVVKFSFNNIFLPDSASDEPGSHGYVNYTIAPKPGLPDGTQITNTAYIYFDFNPAIVTNTTTNTIDYTLSIAVHQANKNVMMLYPNPANDVVNVFINQSSGGDLILSDVLGKQVLVQHVKGGKQQLALKGLSDGIYFITFRSGSLFLSEKLMILK